MSWKIYNGFKFTTSDIFLIHKHIMEWRSELEELHQLAIAQHHADIAIRMFDEATTTKGRHLGKKPMPDALDQVLDNQTNLGKRKAAIPGWDFAFSIFLYPHETGVYGFFVTERREWGEQWMAKTFVEDYAYWSNVDPPIEVPGEEWERRGEIWREILSAPGAHTNMAGFQADCTSEMMFAGYELVTKALPDFDTRVQREARRLTMDAEFSRRAAEATVENESKEDRGKRLFALLKAVDRWTNTPEGIEALSATAANVSELLYPDVTQEDLMAEITEAHCRAIEATQQVPKEGDLARPIA